MAVTTNPLITGKAPFTYSATSITVPSASTFGWSDVILARDAANTLAQRNSTTGQTYRIYNTFTDASNYERGEIRWNSNQFQIITAKAGTGTDRSMLVGTGGVASLVFQTSGTARWNIGSTGHWLAITNNTYDIGASGATSPRTIYAATSVVTPVVAGTSVRLGQSGGSVGFYGTTPVALQTGVAVSAAGVHAALVNLGLITA